MAYCNDLYERLTKDTWFQMVQCNHCRTCWVPFNSDAARNYAWDESIGGYKLTCPGCNKIVQVARTLGP